MTTNSLEPGTELTRKQIHEIFGGRRQGAISPTRNNGIFAFLNPRRDNNFDPNLLVNGQDGEGVLHLLGEGNEGDQQFTQSNKALLEHKQTGRPVHIFEANLSLLAGATAEYHYRYIGRFEIDDTKPYYLVDSPDIRGQSRRVIVFRLHPQPGSLQLMGELSDTAPSSKTDVRPRPLPLESVDAAAKRVRRPSATVARESTTRREAALTAGFAAYLNSLGHTTTRLQLTSPDGTSTVAPDLVDVTTGTMYEVKSSASREAVRFAIGYLFDMRRRPGAPGNLGMLLPADPLSDLRDLCAGLGIEVVWPNPDGTFTSTKS